MSAPKLELVDLRKTYDDGEVVAVDGVSLTLEAGSTLALLGPSGCGKSTTLNMIVGLETPSAGDIRIDGRSIVDTPAGSRDVGLVFQDYAVFSHMTVEKNLAFGLEVRRLGRKEIRKRVDEAADLLGLRGMLREKASRLGGSELQRVAIGAVILGVRPETVHLAPVDDAPFKGRVALVQPRGSEAVVAVELDGARLQAIVPANQAPQEGAIAGLRIELDRMVAYSGETGRRLHLEAAE